MKRIYMFMLLAWCLALGAKAQQVVLGRIINNKDSAVIADGSVVITSTGGFRRVVSTGDNGYFSVALPQGRYRALASSVGYASGMLDFSVPVKGSLLIGLDAADNQLMDVMVNTGYQVLDRTRSTGSFSKVSSEQLNQQVGRNVLDRLEAIGNGLNVDRATGTEGRISIRGLSTIRGPKEPLIILDDFAYSGDLGNINPDDVESITVLKDASAASIWGARAGNGVIVITTKKSRLNAPLAIDFSAAVGVLEKPDLGYEQRMSSADFLGVEEFLFGKGYYTSVVNSLYKQPLTPFVELLLLHSEGKLSGGQLADSKAAFSSFDVYDDFDRYVYDKGVNQQYSLRLSGSGDRNSWSVSAGFNRNMDNLGLIDKRSTLRFSNTFNILKNLQLSSIFTYSDARVKRGRQGIGEIVSYSGLYPYARFADEAGNPLAIVKQYRRTYLSSPATARLLDWSYYPLLDYTHTDNSSGLKDLNANFDLTYRLPFGLKTSLKYSIEEQRASSALLQGRDAYYTRDYINSFTQVPASGAVVYPVPVGAILDSRESTLKSEQYRGQLDYSGSWKEHQVSALVGFEWRRAVTEGSSSRVYGLDTDKLNAGLVDFTRLYPNFVNGGSSYIQNGTSFDLKRNNFISQFANLAYTFRDAYTVSASARADASNVFGISTNNRWRPLWSAGVAWEVTRMPFFKFDFVDFLKLRATYGMSGNVDPGMVGVSTIRYPGISAFTQSPYAVFDKYSNPDLRWEKVGMFNAGVDFNLWKGRLSGSVEYYSKQADDLFGMFPIDYTTGVGSAIIKNVAKIKGNGLDIQLNSNNLSGGFKWQTTLNFSANKDRVVNYYVPNTLGSSFLQSGASVSGIEGLPVYAVFSYQWAGLDPMTGDPMGFVNGVASRDYNALTGPATQVGDLKYHGSALPKYFGNLVNNFSYAGLTLSVSLSFKFDYYFRRKSIDYTNLFDSWNGHADFQQRWRSPGDELQTNVPSLIFPNPSARDAFYKYSEVLIEKGDHIRIQYINLDYAFEKRMLGPLKIKTLNLFANLGNLGIIYRANKKGIDPEYITSGFNLPPGKLFSFGLRTSL